MSLKQSLILVTCITYSLVYATTNIETATSNKGSCTGVLLVERSGETALDRYRRYQREYPHVPNLAEGFDRATLGLFADIERIDPKTGKPQFVREAIERGRDLAVPRITSIRENLATVDLEPLGIRERIFEEDYVIVQIQMGYIPGSADYPTILDSPMKSKLQIMHMQLVNRAYRNSGLIPRETESSFKMMDDYIDHIYSGYIPTLYLVFHKAVWEIQKKSFQNVGDSNSETLPLYPVLGILASENLVSKASNLHDFQFKRLFRNEDQDPLGLLNLPGGPAPELSLHFYRWLFEGLPADSSISVEAHTSRHVRWYKSLDFDENGRIPSQRWNTDVITLASTSTRAQNKVSQLLSSKSQKRP